MITRKDFLKGALVGAGATVNLLPKFYEEMKVILLGTGTPQSCFR